MVASRNLIPSTLAQRAHEQHQSFDSFCEWWVGLGANGLPLWNGAQLAVDTTLVAPLTSAGSTAPPRRGRAKERTYPELVNSSGRCHLTVLGIQVGGRWSAEAAAPSPSAGRPSCPLQLLVRSYRACLACPSPARAMSMDMLRPSVMSLLTRIHRVAAARRAALGLAGPWTHTV